MNLQQRRKQTTKLDMLMLSSRNRHLSYLLHLEVLLVVGAYETLHTLFITIPKQQKKEHHREFSFRVFLSVSLNNNRA